jgi:hypothetical protein
MSVNSEHIIMKKRMREEDRTEGRVSESGKKNENKEV